MDIFAKDEYDQSLKNHKLHGEHADHRSISITGDIRVIYRKITEGKYHLHDIGTHSELYS